MAEDLRAAGLGWRHGTVDADGVPVCTGSRSQAHPAMTSDGVDGAIVTWVDHRSEVPDIYAQRMSGGGTRLGQHKVWPFVGPPAIRCPRRSPRMASAGQSSTWYDRRSSNPRVYARRVLADGSPQWTTDGVALCSQDCQQINPSIASDGEGGAIVTWRHNLASNPDIYAQRVSANGMLLWTAML